MPPPSAGPAQRPEPQRRLRADAQRNYDLLVSAARDVFHEHGVDAPLDDIARRAGVGNATMYRHFPTRRELIIAVYSGEVAEICARSQSLLAEDPPGDALFGWLQDFIAHVATKRELALSITDDRAGQRSALFDRWHDSMHSAASALLTRAQSAGAVRPDLKASELLALANGIALTATDATQAERLVMLIRQGTDTPSAAADNSR
ncbi:TetR/AcrR family transcriptional regulator [Actinomadura madurae]|uniref:TetR/AcrR family transcriptional regulator n=1 Tax=Actinomadura madurae TaxID=1993 RepID=UPI002026D17D|nr:TetR/AcrR family transcriptional regulator [Actinomadura madurae]URM98315.1 TetR/AcrR family transcriptional regulator [Actinomadura madurae]URN09005.1 TetR/AcrR family transcriptional regulator [Actinomadura madurae]